MTSISSFPTVSDFPSYGREQAAAPAIPAQNEPIPTSTPAPSPGTEGDSARARRHAEQPDNLQTRAAADAQLTKAFGAALLARFFQTSVNPPNVRVPPESTLGRWRGLLDSALRAPGFLAWAKAQGLDTTALTLCPSKGEITGFAGGKKLTFSLTDDSGWAEVSRTLLETAKALAPEPEQTLRCPWPSGQVPWDVVGKFYHQPFDSGPAQVAKYRKILINNPNFEFPPLPFASLRSPQALVEQQTALGDDINAHTLVTALESQLDDANGKIDLSKVMLPVHPSSSYVESLDEPVAQVRADQLIKAYDMYVPENAAQACNLAHMLSFDLAHRAPSADRGCALPLTRLTEATTLGRDLQAQVRKVVEQWKAQDPVQASSDQSGPGATSLLGRLLRHLPENTRKMISTNPAAALDELIRSPQANALGKQIQEELDGLQTPTSSLEYVSAALALDLDPAGGALRHSPAGYALYGKQNIGASPAQIISRFTRHLEGKVGVEMAPIAARLLLSISAPEFLAKEMPPNLVYGSHTWASYSIEALRIEKKVPSAVANMTFSQVMLFGQTVPVSEDGERQLVEVRRGPVTDWGVANGVINARADNVYSAIDYNLSVKAMVKQQKELGWASEALKASQPTRKELALQELKRVFGENIEFEKKVITDRDEVWPDIVRYSLLDIYMSGHLGQKVWESSDEAAVPYNSMRRDFHKLDSDITGAFERAFDKFLARRKEAMSVVFRYHLSLMPVADQAVFDNADISFLSLRKPYDKRVLAKVGNHETFKYVSTKPSPEDVEKLTGRFGVLIQADRGAGDIHYYSYFPGQAKLVKEPGLEKPLVSRPQKAWKSPGINGVSRNDTGDNLKIDLRPFYGEPAQGEGARSQILVEQLSAPNTDRLSAQVPSDLAENLPGRYFSKRSLALGVPVSEYFTHGIDSHRTKAKGVTQREQEIKTNRKLDEIFLSLAPFYDGVVAAINGNVSGAVFDLGFDALGFLIPGSKGVHAAFKSGRGVLKAIGKGVVKGIISSVGVDDLIDAPKNISKGLKVVERAGDKVLSSVQKVLPLGIKSFDAHKVYKHKDVVSDFYYKLGGRSERMGPVTAIFLSGSWYAYNALTKTPHGVQLTQYAIIQAVAH